MQLVGVPAWLDHHVARRQVAVNVVAFMHVRQRFRNLKRNYVHGRVLEVAKAGTRDLCSVPDCKTAGKPCIAVDGEPEAGNGAPASADG